MGYTVRAMALRFLLATSILLAALPARAGMPSLRLTDVAQMRLGTISFFLVLFLVSAGAIMGLWNRLRRDLPRLPRLTYGASLAVVGLWGLLFILVLTMISGARELMTPGAWEPTGSTYTLKSQQPATTLPHAIGPERYLKLGELKSALWEYAASNDGRFPAHALDPAIVPAAWELPRPDTRTPVTRYDYFPGYRTTTADEALAMEPTGSGPTRLALLTDGRIVMTDTLRARPATGGTR